MPMRDVSRLMDWERPHPLDGAVHFDRRSLCSGGVLHRRQARRSLVPKGRGIMVDRRTARLIHRSHETLAQLTRMRQEAKEQDRDGWLQRAKAQAERIA